MRNTETKGDEMTSPEILKIKMIETLLEAIDKEDEDDAKQAIKHIKTLLGIEGK